MASAALRNIDPKRPVRSEMTMLLTEQPMIGSTALFMKTVAHQTGLPHEIAATDGRTIQFWPPFFAYQLGDRLGILLHEILHAVFAHPLRGMRLRLKLGASYRHEIMNIAADAIINAGIKAGTSSRITLPSDGVDLNVLAQQAKAIVALTGVKVDHERFGQLSKLSVEWLYDALVRLLEAAEAHRNSCEGGAGQQRRDGGGSDGDSSADDGADQPDKASNDDQKDADDGRSDDEKKRDSFIASMSARPDLLLDQAQGLSIEEIDEGIRHAGAKIRAAMGMHGSLSRNVIDQLSSDIPQVSTPWESSFRSITQRHLSPVRLRQPTRPGRRMLSQEAMGAANISWSPARRRPPVPRVLVGIDSSGSITPKEYLRYLGEVQAMKRRTNAHVIVAVADASIQSVQEIDHVRDIREVEFKGRGGTDFRPIIALGQEMDVDLVVYLTDLMGTFPEQAPSFPVLWTLVGSETPSGYEPPFGRVLPLR